MAFSDILNDPQNQIRVSSGVAPNNMAEGIRAVAGIAGEFIASKREADSTIQRDKLMAELQREFLPLTQAVQQGSISEQEMNLTVDARLRDIKSKNPWRAAEIDKWIKEDLGMKPRANTLSREMDFARQQTEVEEKVFQTAVASGLTAYNDDGTINRPRTVQRMKDVEASLLQIRLAANAAGGAKGQGFTAEDMRQRKAMLATSVNGLINEQVVPMFDQISKEIEGLKEDDVAGYAALQQRIVQNRAALQRVLMQSMGNQGLEQGDYDEVEKSALAKFDNLTSSIFADDVGTARRNIRTLKEMEKQLGVQAGEAFANIKSINSAVGTDIGAMIVQQALISNEGTMQGLKGLGADLGKSINAFQKSSQALKVLEDPNVIDTYTPQQKAETSRGLQGGIDVGIKAPIRKEETGIWINAIEAQSKILASETLNPKNVDNYIKRIDSPNFYTNLQQAYNSGNKEAAARTIDNTAKLATKSLLTEASALNKRARETGFAGVEYNPNTGLFQVKSDAYRALERINQASASSRVLEAGREAFAVSTAASIEELNKTVMGMNKYLNVYAKSRGIINGRELETRHVAAYMLGLPSSRPFTKPDNVKDSEADFQVTQPDTKQIPRRKLRIENGKLVPVTE